MKVINLRKPRSPRFVRRGLAFVPAVAIGASLLGGCVNAPSTAPVSSTMSCPEATVALANMESRLREAQALVADANTPASAERDAKIADAQARVDRAKAAQSKACEAGATSTATSTPSATATPSTSASPTVVCNNWAWAPDKRTDFSWITGGLQSIKDAKTDVDAAKAVSEWMGKVQLDPVLLQGAIKLILDKDVALTDLGNDSCANDQAKQYTIQMYMLLGQARITPDEAPANGVNSGVANGSVYSSGNPTISGDRKAVKVEIYVDGKLVKTFWVLGRCGNGVTVERIYLVTNPAEVCESGPDQGQPVGDDGVCAKDVTQDPQSQGNVPGQSTKNGGSVDNGSEISNGPVGPVDSGNGIPTGSQPRSTPSPSPTHSGGPTLPKPTEPAATLPVPQPTQTASVPPPPPPPA